MRKKIRKISALVVLGMLVLMVYIPMSFGAPSWDNGVSSNTSYYVAIDADNNQTDQAFGVFRDGTPGSGTELFRIQEDGKVGIGTTDPIGSLHIYGSGDILNIVESSDQHAYFNARRGSTNYNAALYTRTASDNFWLAGQLGNPDVNAGNTNDFSFAYYDGSYSVPLEITTSGNVGIGTTSPSQTLHVAGNARITGALYDSNNEAGTNGQILQTTGSGIDWINQSSIFDNDWTISGNHMYSAVSGNVGIGTTSPGELLSLEGTRPEISFLTDLSNYKGRIAQFGPHGLHLSTNLYYDGTDWQREETDYGGAVLTLSNGLTVRTVGSGENPASLSNVLMITNSGDFGIGTTTPDEKFEVEWDTNVDVEIGRGTSDIDITFIALRNAEGEKTYIYPNADQNGLHVTPTHP